MQDNYQQKVGIFGQTLAKKYLQKKEYEILAEHFYIRGGEVDLVAKEKKEIVFVEVKTRTSKMFGLPEDAVDKYKRQSLLRSAEVFMQQKRIFGKVSFRFDIISVFVDKTSKRANIRHFKDILI